MTESGIVVGMRKDYRVTTSICIPHSLQMKLDESAKEADETRSRYATKVLRAHFAGGHDSEKQTNSKD